MTGSGIAGVHAWRRYGRRCRASWRKRIGSFCGASPDQGSQPAGAMLKPGRLCWPTLQNFRGGIQAESHRASACEQKQN